MKKGLTAFFTSLMIFSLVCTLCFGITGCGSKISNVDISELQSREGLTAAAAEIRSAKELWVSASIAEQLSRLDVTVKSNS